MLRAIAAAKKKNDRIDAAKIPIACAATFCRNATWPPQRFRIGAGRCAIGHLLVRQMVRRATFSEAGELCGA
jgi:hypothetical protein